MTWGAVGGAAASAVIGGMMSKDGGGGTQTVSKDPWGPAQPWLTSLLGQGQNLQAQYQANPFNDLQQGAYASLLQGNDYINQMTPGLLAQFSQPTGFDRNNPRAKPQAFQFPTMQGMPTLANRLGPSMAAAPGMSAPVASAPAPVQGLFGTGPAPVAIPGVTAPALPPTTYAGWLSGFGGEPTGA